MTIDYLRKEYKNLSKRILKNKSLRHTEPSLIYSLDNNITNSFLIDLSIKSIKLAWQEIVEIDKLHLKDSIYFNIFPGEHYRLLKAITKILNPKLAVEIGTYTGMGSTAIIQGQSSGQLFTYDIFPWNTFDTHLDVQHFKKGLVIQKVCDLSNPREFEINFPILNKAEIIFIDAPKDGVFEYHFLKYLTLLEPQVNKILILDDIRFVNMIDLWTSITSPKLDITSFGHWSGTGIVDIGLGLKLDTTGSLNT